MLTLGCSWLLPFDSQKTESFGRRGYASECLVLTFGDTFAQGKGGNLREWGTFPPSFPPPCGLLLLCLSWFPVSLGFYTCMSEMLRGLHGGTAISKCINSGLFTLFGARIIIS